MSQLHSSERRTITSLENHLRNVIPLEHFTEETWKWLAEHLSDRSKADDLLLQAKESGLSNHQIFQHLKQYNSAITLELVDSVIAPLVEQKKEFDRVNTVTLFMSEKGLQGKINDRPSSQIATLAGIVTSSLPEREKVAKFRDVVADPRAYDQQTTSDKRHLLVIDALKGMTTVLVLGASPDRPEIKWIAKTYGEKSVALTLGENWKVPALEALGMKAVHVDVFKMLFQSNGDNVKEVLANQKSVTLSSLRSKNLGVYVNLPGSIASTCPAFMDRVMKLFNPKRIVGVACRPPDFGVPLSEEMAHFEKDGFGVKFEETHRSPIEVTYHFVLKSKGEQEEA